jgi:hypothetical protein
MDYKLRTIKPQILFFEVITKMTNVLRGLLGVLIFFLNDVKSIILRKKIGNKRKRMRLFKKFIHVLMIESLDYLAMEFFLNRF